jgi:site-specific DNA-methyltransferase (adenine-specific)
MADYTLYNADCLNILPTLEAQSVDAIICDPPYGTTACKWDSVIPFAPMWEGIRRVLKPRGACVLFGSQPFTSALVMSNVGWFKEEIIWEKDKATGFLDVRRKHLKAHENLLLFADGAYAYTPQMSDGHAPTNHTQGRRRGSKSPVYNGALGRDNPNGGATIRYPRTVQRFNTVNSAHNPVHPTQKPLALLEYLVKTYTNEGDTVLDFTMGSGTTGHACGNLGRRFAGIEKDAGYYDIAAERIATAYAPLRMMEQVS